MLNTFRARNNCEHEAKFVQDRIVSVERHIIDLCNIFAQYSRKAARLRDKGDELAKVAQNYADSETINRSLSVGLENFAECMSFLNSYGNLRVENLDGKVVKEFTRYEDICKGAKDDVKTLYNAREKEILRKRQLERAKERKPRNREHIMQAESELVKATVEFSKTLNNLEGRCCDFEKQKLHDVKSILLDFISIEMGYHAKALEVLTVAFGSISDINEEADLQDFRKITRKVDAEMKKSLKVPKNLEKNPKVQGMFRSANSLGSLGALFQGRSSTSARNNAEVEKSISKSEETLDSMKRSVTDTEEDSADDTTEENSDSDDKTPPVVVRKYRNK